MPTFLEIFSYLLALKIFWTTTSLIYCVKLAHLERTQTFTWIAFGAAFAFRLVTQVNSIVLNDSIFGAYSGRGTGTLIYTQSIEVIIVGMAAIAVLRSFYGMKKKLLANNV